MNLTKSKTTIIALIISFLMYLALSSWFATGAVAGSSPSGGGQLSAGNDTLEQLGFNMEDPTMPAGNPYGNATINLQPKLELFTHYIEAQSDGATEDYRLYDGKKGGGQSC